MRKPTLAAELQQLLCATNWMRTSIPNYATVIAPLHELMESIYSKMNSRKKRSIAKCSLQELWGNRHDVAFTTIKKQLAQSTTLAYPKSNHTLCLYTDASDTHWASALSQVPTDQLKKPIEEQNHEPMSFLSGSFTGPAAGWSTPEKEGFAVVESMCRLDYLTAGQEIAIFTDHANLVYLFDPYGQNPGIPRHTASKLMRWALKLSAFRYVIEHVAGDRNVWADMLTRWAVQPKTTVSAVKLKALILAPIAPHLDTDYDWPRISDITKSQSNTAIQPPTRFLKKNGIFQDKSGAFWVPSSDRHIKARILVAGHAGMAGHRGIPATQNTIKRYFWWKMVDEDIEIFVKSCIHCLCTQTGHIVPRPLGHALHAERSNEMIHFDFCYMMKGENNYNYILVIKDDFSGYVWLVPATETTAEVTAKALLQWFSSFGVALKWVSDRGSHFKNEVVRVLRERTNGSHHFTLAYCPWSNGTVEVVCRELLRGTRAILSEFQLPQKCWPTVVPLVQSVLNSTLLPRLGNRCPLEVFTGHDQDSPLLSITNASKQDQTVHTLSEVKAKRLLQVEKVQNALHEMHRDVIVKANKTRESAVNRHNAKTNVRPINFTNGDFVLRGIFRKEKQGKPALRWKGPCRVIACKSDYIFKVEDLLTGKRSHFLSPSRGATDGK